MVSVFEEAHTICENEYGIIASDWILIDDLLEGCQDDWIAPVRIKGRNIGKPVYGHLEKLEDGVWKEFTINK